MGELVIKIPQDFNLQLSVESEEAINEILRIAKRFKKKSKVESEDESLKKEDETLKKYGDLINKSNFIPPRRNNLKEDLAEACGIWADREESAQEIARTIRDKNNGKI